MMHDYEQDAKLARFAVLEAKAKADHTDWEVFFEAAEAWEDLVATSKEGYPWSDRAQTVIRQANALVEEHWKRNEPTLMARFWAKITNRTKR